MKKLFFIFTLLAFCLTGADFAQTRENFHTLRGVIKNQESLVIPGLRMVFKSSAGETIASTDINGDFETRLAPGLYELTVSQTISDKFTAFINIRENGLNPDFIEFVVETGLNPRDASCPETVELAKPVYPMAARAVRASGEVVVIVKINQEGNVVSAKAVSGHPLLRAASEKAAMKSRFAASENIAERDAKLTFVFLDWVKEKENIKRFAAPCRMEVIGEELRIVDVTDYE
jgi:TonB family protein